VNKIIALVLERLRENLTGLLQKVEASGLTPETFMELVADLKVAANEAALVALMETVLRYEEQGDVVRHGGQLHRFKLVSDKEWLTPFGLATIPRNYFQPDAGGKGVVPLDEHCGMTDRYMTPDVEELRAYASAHLVPAEVERFVGKVLAQGPSAKAIKRVIEDVGSFAEQAEARIEKRMRKAAPLSRKGDVLVQSWDGVNTPLRETGTKTGRKPQRPGVRADDRTPTVWKEAGVAAISIYGRDEKGYAERLDTRYLARMPESGMKRLLEQQNELVKPLLENRRLREVVLLCDGKRSIWNAAESLCSFPRATLILDFYHASEHLSKAAEAIFGAKSIDGRRWYEKYRERLRDEYGGATAAIRSLEYHARKARRGSTRWKTIRGVINYFRSNLEKMNYADFQDRGLPIGSGPVEAACKTVVGARLKRSGMRWSREGGQNVLNLRVHVLSGRWDVFWRCYLDERRAAA
jgi:hypothetical protein